MFVIEKKERKQLRWSDVVLEVLAECIRRRSLKPFKMLFHRGRYGKHLCLDGSLKDYMNYMRRTRG